MRADQFEHREHVAIDVLVFFSKGVSPEEWRAPLSFTKKPKEPDGELIQPFQHAIQFRSAELFKAADRSQVAAKLLEAVIAHAHAEVLSDDIFDLMSLIENDGVIFGQDAAFIVFVLQRQIGEEEVMVHNDDVAFERALMHGGDEAALEIRTLLPGAEIAAGIDLSPGGPGFGQRFDVGAISEFRGFFPSADDLEIGQLFQAREHRLLFSIVDFLAARVIAAALHVADIQWPREMLLQERNIFEEELLLEVFGPSGNHDALA